MGIVSGLGACPYRVPSANRSQVLRGVGVGNTRIPVSEAQECHLLLPSDVTLLVKVENLTAFIGEATFRGVVRHIRSKSRMFPRDNYNADIREHEVV